MKIFGDHSVVIVVIILVGPYSFIYQLDAAVVVSNGCSDVCDYNVWGKSADCEQRNLELVPQECHEAKSLKLQRNRVVHICAGTFKNFTALKYLYLDRNNLSSVEQGAFQGCDQIETVHLSDNNFPTVTSFMMDGLGNAANMHIDRSKVQRVEESAFGNLTRLRVMSLQDNQLTSPPCDAFAEGNSLHSLYLSSNVISELPDGCFSALTHLVRLVLKNNPLVDPNPVAFQSLRLTHLDLQYTNLTHVPTGIFSYVNTIQTLYLSSNNIRHLSNRDFVSLPSLRQLYLQHNQLVSIHEQSFQNLRELSFLELSSNLLESIGEGALESCSNLEELRLHKNRLPSTRNITFSHHSRLRTLELADNPLRCDCAISPLQFWLANNDADNTNMQPAICASPERFEGQLVSHLNHNDLCVESTPLINPDSNDLPANPPESPNSAPMTNLDKETNYVPARAVSDVMVIAIAVGVTAFLIMLMVIIALYIMRRPRPQSIDHKNPRHRLDSAKEPLGIHVTDNPLDGPDLPPRPRAYERRLTPTTPPPSTEEHPDFPEEVSYMTIRSDSGGPTNPIHPNPPPTPPPISSSDQYSKIPEETVTYSSVFPDSEEDINELPVETFVQNLDFTAPPVSNQESSSRNEMSHTPPPKPRAPPPSRGPSIDSGYVSHTFAPSQQIN